MSTNVSAGTTDRTIEYDVARAVAQVRDVDTMELEPLYETIDPDALARLFRPDADGRVTFSWAGCEVTVDSIGEITVHRLGESRSRRDTAVVRANAEDVTVCND